ncbi:hypothetical protein GQ457_01G027450 [Hibiscus cannabinus]
MDSISEQMQNLNIEGTQPFFAKRITVKLEDKTFLNWKQQVLLTLRSHGLEKCLYNAIFLLTRFSVTDTCKQMERVEYNRFVKQECALAS